MSRDILSGRFSEPELDILPYAVKESENVIDIGANFGMYTYPLSKLVGRKGIVYAYEPVPFTYKTLAKVVKNLSIHSVLLSNKAVSDTKGEISFSIPLQKSGQLMAGQAYLGTRNDDHPGKETQVRWDDLTEITCNTVTLDEEIDPSMNISFIKIDIEGAEYFAFKGAKKLIEINKPTILIEINPWFLDGFNLTLYDLLNPFEEKNYKLFKYEAHKLIQIDSYEKIEEDNYLLIHPKYINRFSSLF